MRWLRHPAAPEIAVSATFVIGGLAVAERGLSYSVGSITDIGPGFFPFGLGLLLAALAGLRLLAIALEWRTSTAEDSAAEKFPWRPTIVITVAMVGWILMLKPYGLVPATIMLVLVTSLSESPIRPAAVLVSAIALPAATYFLFVYILQMPLAAITW